MEEDIYNQEAAFIDVTNAMFRTLEILQDSRDMNATRTLISQIQTLLESQGLDRESAWRFVSEEWFA